MLSKAEVDQIMGMLNEDTPIPNIAQQLNISKGTVYDVKNGNHRYTRPASDSSGDQEFSIHYPHAKAAYQWCGGCRARVKMPCLVCQIRKLNDERLARNRNLGIVSVEPQEVEEAKVATS